MNECCSDLPLGKWGFSETFKHLYLSKIEKHVGKQILVEYSYPGFGWTYSLLSYLGGEIAAETTIQEFICFLKTADRSALSYGCFIKDIYENLRLVSASYRNGWNFFVESNDTFGYAHWHFVARTK
jgi:hypothetical protein